MTVTEHNEIVAIIRRDAGLLLNLQSEVCAVLMECGVPAEAAARLPPILEGETETRLRELVARAPIELVRDADFLHRAVQECEDAIAELCAWRWRGPAQPAVPGARLACPLQASESKSCQMTPA
jgi:hypothetical protein